LDLYDPAKTDVSKGALVQLALALNAYRDDMVLAGGWAPYFLVKDYFDHCGSIDIDLVLNLVGNPIKNISANGLALVTDKIDFANARIEFESGTIADLTASRIAENKKRTMAVYQRDANYQLNFIDRSAFKMSHDIRQHQFSVPEENGINNFQSTKNNSNGYKSQLSSPNQAENNLLSLELNSFIDAIQKNGQPYVNGLAGTQALEVAFEIMDKIENCHYPVNHTANLINT